MEKQRNVLLKKINLANDFLVQREEKMDASFN
jgi:hypothetical protein